MKHWQSFSSCIMDKISGFISEVVNINSNVASKSDYKLWSLQMLESYMTITSLILKRNSLASTAEEKSLATLKCNILTPAQTKQPLWFCLKQKKSRWKKVLSSLSLDRAIKEKYLLENIRCTKYSFLECFKQQHARFFFYCIFLSWGIR